MQFIPELGSFNTNFNFNGRFKLISFSDIFTPESYAFLQKGFQDLDWEKKETHFYSQFSVKLDPNKDLGFSGLFHRQFFHPFKLKLETVLKTKFRDSISIIAHKLITSQEVGIHNDYTDPELGYESYRFIFQFKKNTELHSGGEISFLNSENKTDVIRQFSYSKNSGICFEINPYSYHCVSQAHGERHSLVMYLWDEKKKYDQSGTEIIL